MPPTRLPRPWLAGLLSLFMPGASLFYAGQRRRGLWVAGAAVGLIGILLVLRLAPPTVGSIAAFMGCGALMLAVTIVAAVAGHAGARQARRDGSPRSSWPPVLALVVFGVATGNLMLRAPGWVGRPFYNLSMPSGSMMPGIPVGMRVFMAGGTVPDRGSVVVFRPKPGSGEQWVKRVVALGGDRVAVRAGCLYVNGVAAAPGSPVRELLDGHPYDIVPMPAARLSQGGEMAERTVPDGTMFVLGDNRPDSMDSRFAEIGFVPLDRVDAVGGVAYWVPGVGLTLRPLL